MSADYTCPQCGSHYLLVYTSDPTASATDHLPDHCVWCGYCIHHDLNRESNFERVLAAYMANLARASAARLN